MPDLSDNEVNEAIEKFQLASEKFAKSDSEYKEALDKSSKAIDQLIESDTKKKSSTLARLRINHSPLMGQSEINGKSVNVEVVEGGTYICVLGSSKRLIFANVFTCF